MTVLGKVLVFVNLAFSLAVAFFITQSYAKRTNWHHAYQEADKALQAATAQRDQYLKEKQEAIDDSQAKIRVVAQERDKVSADLKNVQAVVADLRGQMAKKDETLAKYGMNTEAGINEVKKLSERATILETHLKDANKRLDDQAKVVEDFRQRAVSAEIEKKSLQDRNDQLVKVIAEKEQELVRLRASATGVVTASASMPNPPPGDVEGRVKNYDPTSGLLTLTVGSDAGIVKGHTLYVYRLEPSGQYVGQVRILEVRPNEAVGKMVNKPRTPVQVNDKVASKIS